jgi:hypothetical protein
MQNNTHQDLKQETKFLDHFTCSHFFLQFVAEAFQLMLCHAGSLGDYVVLGGKAGVSDHVSVASKVFAYCFFP